jgi:hypothetical protein
MLAEAVQVAFTLLVDCMQAQLQRVMSAFLDPSMDDLHADGELYDVVISCISFCCCSLS